MLGYGFPVLPTGGSVSSIAFAMALYFGFRKIVFMGQDLALPVENHILPELREHLAIMINTLRAVARWKWKESTEQCFRRISRCGITSSGLKKAIRDGGDRMRVIDATEGGAKIEGAENMKMSEVVAGECPAEFDFRRLNRRYRRHFLWRNSKNWKKLQKIETSGRDLQKFIEKQIQALDSLCRKSGGDTGVTDNDVRVLRDMLEENDILEHMPLFGMMTVYAQKAEYELGDTIYTKEKHGNQRSGRAEFKFVFGIPEGSADAVGGYRG